MNHRIYEKYSPLYLLSLVVLLHLNFKQGFSVVCAFTTVTPVVVQVPSFTLSRNGIHGLLSRYQQNNNDGENPSSRIPPTPPQQQQQQQQQQQKQQQQQQQQKPNRPSQPFK